MTRIPAPLAFAFALSGALLATNPVLAQSTTQHGFAGGEKAIERMRAADTNHDGAISRSEMTQARKSNWQRMDRNKDGYFTKSDLPRFAQSRWDGDKLVQIRREFDTDHDGRLSYAEFVDGPMLGFDMADTDRNGLVTQAELEAISARIRAQRG